MLYRVRTPQGRYAEDRGCVDFTPLGADRVFEPCRERAVMIQSRTARSVTFALAAVLALALVLVISGCGKSSGTTDKNTAKGALSAARSSLSTMAPDAKLLLVQTAQAVAATETPVWAYLFGSPSTDKTYIVYVNQGSSMGASEYGTAGLTPDEWKSVPDVDAWEIDSKDAYTKAFKAAGGKGSPNAYQMGMLTFVPESASDATSKTFVWYVQFDPGASGATTATIEVDAKSGKTTVSTQ